MDYERLHVARPKIKVSFQIAVEGGCPSHAYELSTDYAWGFEQLQRALEDAVDLFKLRQKQYQRDYIEEWGKDPFAEVASAVSQLTEKEGNTK